METPRVRPAKREDIGAVADLIVRMKKLNNEFDPLFGVVEDAQKKARVYVAASVNAPRVVLLVAVQGTKVVGVIRAEVRERYFYRPVKEGHITDFYILPEFRRKALGNDVLDRSMVALKKMGAELLTAEVPSRNEIAVKFYNKRGFRSLNQVFAKFDQ